MRIILSEGFMDKIKGFFENPCTEEMLVTLEKLLTKLMMANVSNTSLSGTLAYELQGFKKKNKDCWDNPEWADKTRSIEEKVEFLERKRSTQSGGHFMAELRKDPAYFGPWSKFHEMYTEGNTDPEDLKVIEMAKAIVEGRRRRVMRITERQLRRIIKEELQFPDDVLVDSDSEDYQQGYTDAYYDGLPMQKNQSQQYQDGWHDGQLDIVRDKDPYGSPLPAAPQKLKVGDIVRKVDYYGDGSGGDFKKSVGDQIGTVIEIDEDIDGTQYTVIFPDGTTVMDTGDEFEIINESAIKTTKRQLRRIIREIYVGEEKWDAYQGYREPAPMTLEQQQADFDDKVDKGAEPAELKATGNYPDVDSLSSDVARRYLDRKYSIGEAIDVSRSRLFHPEKNPRLQLPRNVVEQEIAKVIESFRTGEYVWSPGAQREFKNMALAGAGTDGWRFDAFPNWENKDFQTVIDAMSV